jgi:thiaminase (transcriptional activator TenA)
MLCAGLATVLPCFWVYQHIGQTLNSRGSTNAKYQAWINMYGGQEFDETVQQAIRMMDAVGRQLGAEQQAACVKHFVMNARLEFMFFDGPCSHEVWPC